MSQGEQKLSALIAEDHEEHTQRRFLIEAYLGNEDSRQKYLTAAGKLGLLRALLANRVFAPTQTYELQSMGVILGDTFAQELGMNWVVVEDSYGRDFALQYPDTTILLYPLTMISKRIEAGEDVDVFEMFNSLAVQIEDILAEQEN